MPVLLAAQGHAKGPDVPTPIKRAQTHCVFAGRKGWKVDGIAFVSAVGNSVLGKQRRPGRAIKAEVCPLNLARSVINFEHSSNIATA